VNYGRKVDYGSERLNAATFMAAITALRAFSVLHSCMKRISEAGMP
jgi:hypothetical protein